MAEATAFSTQSNPTLVSSLAIRLKQEWPDIAYAGDPRGRLTQQGDYRHRRKLDAKRPFKMTSRSTAECNNAA
jgi:hypothetical protein